MDQQQKTALINLAVFLLAFFATFFIVGSALWGLFLALAASIASDVIQQRMQQTARQ